MAQSDTGTRGGLGGEPMDQLPNGPEESVSEAVSEARRRLAGVPAATVVANHAIGLYELAAIHLSADPADLEQASLAIDALGGLLEATGPRLGDDADTLTQALTTIRMAYVSVARTPPAG